MELLIRLLYWISTGLLLPVIVALLFYLVYAFLQAGGAYGVFVERLRYYRAARPVLEELDAQHACERLEHLITGRTRVAAALARVLAANGSAARGEKVVADFELEAQRELASARTLVRMGPTLGLMGTLIPMGPALVGLARGDVAALAENLQVAFATTVLGLLVGGVGFLVLHAKQRWYAEDANVLHYVHRLLEERTHARFAL